MQTIERVIELHEEEILRSWTELARHARSARGLALDEVRNLIDRYLSFITKQGEQALLGFESHLSSRIRQGFSLGDILEEFALLGRCVTRVCATLPPEERPAPVEFERLFAALQATHEAVTEEFNQHFLKDEQTEKRYMRLIQQSFSESPDDAGGPHTPLPERLHEVVELVMEAMEADASALLVFEPERRELIMSASAGVAQEVLSSQARSLSTASFAGLIASRPETTSVDDAETTELEVSPALRDSGIHSLLGARVPRRHMLVGVLYVGVCERRPFTLREMRRLQAIAERMALLLENSNLYAALQQRVEELAEQRRVREQFISVLAHDLRGPLSAAGVAAKILSQLPDEYVDAKEVRKRAALILRNVNRTDTMVRDLLDGQRINAGERLTLRLEECDLVAIVRDVVEELTTTGGGQFVLSTDDAVRGIWSGSDLRRTIWNLATNAVKHGQEGTPVHITVRKRSDGAEVAVHNDGPAIPEDQQALLFRPFARGANATHPGWGLGLVLVRGVAEAHGGSIQVESAEGRGTTFTLRIPIHAPPSEIV